MLMKTWDPLAAPANEQKKPRVGMDYEGSGTYSRSAARRAL